MLVLTREKNEVLLIGNDVRIEVLSIDGSQIKIGIDAPKEILVLRAELLNTDFGSENAANDALAEDRLTALKRRLAGWLFR